MLSEWIQVNKYYYYVTDIDHIYSGPENPVNVEELSLSLTHTHIFTIPLQTCAYDNQQ